MDRPAISNPKFIRLLKQKSLLPENYIDDLLLEFRGNTLDLLATLIHTGVASKRFLCQLWSDSIGVAHVDLEKSLFQPHVVRRLPEKIARRVYAIPVYKMGEITTVATATPKDPELKKNLELIIGGPVSLVFALPSDIEKSIEKEYKTQSALLDFFVKIGASRLFLEHEPITSEKLTETAGEEAINQLHVCMILYGITRNASEIHVIPGSENGRIEYVIYKEKIPPIEISLDVYEQLSMRLKSIAGVNLTLTERPQKGRILFATPGKKIDLRFTTHPTEHGESLFLKIQSLKPYSSMPALTSLHVAKRINDQIIQRIAKPHGLLLIAGPSGSGRTALAYSILSMLSGKSGKAMSVEESIKYLIPGIDQLQVNPEADFDAAAAIEACMRRQANILYLQYLEKDEKRVEIAVNAALSGRLVISGIEADNSRGALKKAIDLGTAHAVTGILSTRLVARLCDHCKEAYHLSKNQASIIFSDSESHNLIFFKPKGCPYCSQTGFSGRVGLHELVWINSKARKKIIDNAPFDDIWTTIEEDEIYPFFLDGIKKTIRGLTTFDEILRIAPI